MVPTITVLVALVPREKIIEGENSRSSRDTRTFLDLLSLHDATIPDIREERHSDTHDDDPHVALSRWRLKCRETEAPSCWVSLVPGNPTRPETAPRFSRSPTVGIMGISRPFIHLASQPDSRFSPPELSYRTPGMGRARAPRTCRRREGESLPSNLVS